MFIKYEQLLKFVHRGDLVGIEKKEKLECNYEYMTSRYLR